MKRAFEIVISSIALLTLLPLGLLIAAILRCTGDRHIFYRQTRLGKGLRSFSMLKFVSMRSDAQNPGGGPLTVRNDPRVFPFGRFLRATKLNEIPQLVNVLRGDMGFVGPRPILPREQAHLAESTNRRIFSVTPGVTGIASIVFRDEEQLLSASPKGPEACYREDIAPLKADLDIWYSEHHSRWIDLRIMLLTAWVIVRPSSTAYSRLLGGQWPAFRERIDALYASVGLHRR